MEALAILFALMVGHALADYPMQGDYLSRAKDRNGPLGQNGVWMHALSAHALIHAGFVAAISALALWSLGVIGWLGLALAFAMAEFAMHFVIDFAKTEKRIGYHLDQALHFACKVAWVVVITARGA